jgi:hypothetical protein
MDPADRARYGPRRRPRRSVSGSRSDAFAKHVVDYYGGLCHLCDHGGAKQSDHLIPVTERPDLEFDLSNCRPAHGAPGNSCPVCRVNCNQVRGGLSIDRARRIIAERAAGNAKAPGTRASTPPERRPDPDAGRPW